MTKNMLEALPLDIIYMVADLLPRQSIQSLCQVSTGLFAALVPRLYETIAFRAVCEWALNALGTDAFLQRHGRTRAAQLLQHTRRISVEAPFYIARFNRCVFHRLSRLPDGPHGELLTLGSPSDSAAHSAFLRDLSAQMGSVLAHCNPDSLHTFCWHLGTCLPANILDENGYLLQQQKHVKCVSLVTDGTCPYAGHGLEGLPQLASLSEVGWEGIQHSWELDILRQCLQRNQAHLRTLTIAVLASGDASHHHLPLPELSPSWPGLCQEAYPTLFPTLSSLSLSNVTFPDGPLDGSQSLSFPALQELTLRNCGNQLRFLRVLAQAKTPLSLKRLEVSSDLLQESDHWLGFIAIVEILLSFRGLQHLYLKMSNFPKLLPGFHEAIIHHQSTLKSLGFHERQLIAIDDEGFFEDTRDVLPGSTRDIPRLIEHCPVTALGLCIAPVVAHNLLAQGAEHSSLQLLHIRFSGSERVHRNIKREIMYELHTKRKSDDFSSRRHWRTFFRAHGGNSVPHLPRYLTSAGQIRSDSISIEAREFVAFAQWAFGPTGLPALQILAFGDFSHHGRYRQQQFLVRRKQEGYSQGRRLCCCKHNCTEGWTFDTASIDDASVWDDLPLDGPRFLSTCPTGELIESPL